MTSSRRLQWGRVLSIVLAVSLQTRADPVRQDFSAVFTPSGVTVVLVDAFGNTFTPFEDHLVPGLTAYDGRVAFISRNGGLNADQDVDNVTATFNAGDAIFTPLAETFDGPDVPGSLVVESNGTLPAITEDGWLRLTNQGENNVTASVGFPQVFAGPYDTAVFEFDLRFCPGARRGADGISFLYPPVRDFGDSGAAPDAVMAEEPNVAGTLGVGFDIHENGGEGKNSVSLHFDGSQIASIPLDDTSLPSIENGVPVHVTITVAPVPLLPPVLKGGTNFAIANEANVEFHLIRTGPMDAFLRLLDESDDQENIVAFDHTMDGLDVQSSFHFRALSEQDGRGEGMSYLLAPTSDYGTTGSQQIPGFPLLQAQEPNLPGVFGVAFDTFNDNLGPDDGTEPTSPGDDLGNHVSIHWDGARVAVAQLDPVSELDLVTENADFWHHATVAIDRVGAGSNVRIIVTDGTDGSAHVVFDDFIEGLLLDSVRPVFAARATANFDNYDLDNVNVGFVDRDTLEAGDSDEDYDFDAYDFVLAHQGGKYENDRPADWRDGDWTGDGFYNSSDLVAAFTAGRYETGPYGPQTTAQGQGFPLSSDGEASISIVYDSTTGDISLELDTPVTTLILESAGGVFVGDKPPSFFGVFDIYTASTAFKLAVEGFDSLSPFAQAPAGLEEAFLLADLRVNGSLASGGGLGTVNFVYLGQPLEAGDSDEDYDFDAYDFVKAYQALRYENGFLADWSQGDWNGAPGGSPGRAPTGDGVFNSGDLVTAFSRGVYAIGPYGPQTTPRGHGSPLVDNRDLCEGSVTVIYDAISGEIALETG